MYANRMTVDVTIKCGECPRVGAASAQLSQTGTGELIIQPDAVQPPADWERKQVDRQTWELFCPICVREGRL